MAGQTVTVQRVARSAEECARRFPRLLRCAQWAAILSSGEAACALRDIELRDRWAGGEAVSHFGGPEAVVRAAVRVRHIVRREGRRS